MAPHPKPDRPGVDSDPGSPATSTVFRLLSRKRRRIVLEALVEHHCMTMADLAERVAARETGSAFETLSEEDILRVYASLWHQHVPKLVDGDLVEYHQERDLVRLSPAAESVEGFIF